MQTTTSFERRLATAIGQHSIGTTSVVARCRCIRWLAFHHRSVGTCPDGGVPIRPPKIVQSHLAGGRIARLSHREIAATNSKSI